MGSIAINGSTYNDVTQAMPGGQSVPTAGIYYPTGGPAEWGQPARFGPPLSDRREIKFPGVANTAEKDYQFMKRFIFVDLLVFAASVVALRAAVKTLLDGIATNTRYTITINSTPLQGCKLDMDAPVRSQRIPCGNGVVGELLSLTFKQLSDTN